MDTRCPAHARCTRQSFAVWGGVPHYWEQAIRFSNRQDAIRGLVYERDGLLAYGTPTAAYG